MVAGATTSSSGAALAEPLLSSTKDGGQAAGRAPRVLDKIQRSIGVYWVM